MAVELVVCAPLLAGFIWLVIFGGRIALAHQAVQTAAADAARAASIADESLSNARSSMTAEVKFFRSRTSPTVRALVWATRSSRTASHRLRGR